MKECIKKAILEHQKEWGWCEKLILTNEEREFIWEKIKDLYKQYDSETEFELDGNVVKVKHPFPLSVNEYMKYVIDHILSNRRVVEKINELNSLYINNLYSYEGLLRENQSNTLDSERKTDILKNINPSLYEEIKGENKNVRK